MACVGRTHNLIVSLDFGSTFSSAAWAIISTDRAGRVTELEHRRIDKFPTELGSDPVDYLDADRPLRDDETPIKLFKLLLAPDRDWRGAQEDQDIVKFVENVVESSEFAGGVEDLIYTFVRGLWNEAFVAASTANGHIQEKSQVITVVTYPYLFRGRPLQRFQDAVNRAREDEGFQQPYFITEHSAAIWGVRRSVLDQVDPHDIMIVVDCGGITIDGSCRRFQSFMDRVDDSCDMNPLSRLAGGIYIDHLFERLVEDTIIEITDQQPEEWGDALREAKSELMRLWHGGFKQSFTGLLSSRQITFKIEPTDTYIDITNDDIKSKVFNPVVEIIIDVISQLEQSAREYYDLDRNDPVFVVLTGGLSCCYYIKQRIRYLNKKKAVRIIPDNRGWHAVVEGGLLWGLCEVERTAAVENE